MQRSLSTLVCIKRERNDPASANQGFLQPAKAAAMCTAPHAETRPPPHPTFLLAQNLSSKQIVATDNVRPKFHDEYTSHQWLQG